MYNTNVLFNIGRQNVKSQLVSSKRFGSVLDNMYVRYNQLCYSLSFLSTDAVKKRSAPETGRRLSSFICVCYAAHRTRRLLQDQQRVMLQLQRVVWEYVFFIFLLLKDLSNSIFNVFHWSRTRDLNC